MCERVLLGHIALVRGVCALADGRIMSASLDKTCRVWDTTMGTCERVFKGHTAAVNGIRALADGRVVSASRDKTLRVWRV
jgi:WD40 repeat protein